MQDLLSILFYVRKSKNKTNLEATVYLRITYDRNRAELSTMRKVPLAKWHAKSNTVLGSSAEAKKLNRYFEVTRNRVYDIYQKLLDSGAEITANRIKDEFLGKNTVHKTILTMFEEHNNKMKNLVGKDYSFRTLQRYTTTKRHLKSFIFQSLNQKDYPVKDIDVKFINSFIYFLKTHLDLSHNSALKYLAYFKKIIRIAFANGWIEKDPFYNFKLKTQTIEREFLTKEEVIQIMEKEFSIPRIEHVRDIFIFSCYTGLSYSDVEKLTEDDIVTGIDGNFWIKIKRTKTKTLSSIPLLPVAEDLVKKYRKTEFPKGNLLPVLSNQKTNSYLKEIADCCGIKKNLTFHMARHTFATTITLSNGVPIESVSKMLGHRSLKTTQHYAKILDGKLSDDMNLLKKRITSNQRLRIKS